jgi:beta-N-acetylhexosaminidase
MKRGMIIAIIFLVGIVVCACGKNKAKVLQTDQPSDTMENETKSASGTAADTPQISSDRAFSMAEELLNQMTLEEKIGQMFMVHLSQIDSSHTLDGNQYKVTPQMRQMLKKYHFGAVYLTVNNMANEKQTKKLVHDLQASVSGSALYIAVEEENGQAVSEDDVYKESREKAEELADMGINLNLAPVADVASENNLEYAKHCFGYDADLVEEMTEKFVSGMSAGGLGTTLKYFPGIGNVAGDTRVELLENTDSLMTLRNLNFSIYSAGINAGADAVMMSTVVVKKVTMDKTPAFLSKDIVTSILREEIGFDGVVMTPFLNDVLISKKYTPGYVAVEAVKAGCDMIVLSEDWKESYEALVTAVERGEIDEKAINTAVQRILKNKIQRGILVLEQ